MYKYTFSHLMPDPYFPPIVLVALMWQTVEIFSAT